MVAFNGLCCLLSLLLWVLLDTLKIIQLKCASPFKSYLCHRTPMAGTSSNDSLTFDMKKHYANWMKDPLSWHDLEQHLSLFSTLVYTAGFCLKVLKFSKNIWNQCFVCAGSFLIIQTERSSLKNNPKRRILFEDTMYKAVDGITQFWLYSQGPMRHIQCLDNAYGAPCSEKNELWCPYATVLRMPGVFGQSQVLNCLRNFAACNRAWCECVSCFVCDTCSIGLGLSLHKSPPGPAG